METLIRLLIEPRIVGDQVISPKPFMLRAAKALQELHELAVGNKNLLMTKQEEVTRAHNEFTRTTDAQYKLIDKLTKEVNQLHAEIQTLKNPIDLSEYEAAHNADRT